MIDRIDEIILSALSRNAKQDIREIWDYLRDCGYSLSEEEIECRISRLEDDGIITKYTIAVDTKKLNSRITRMILGKVQTITAFI